MGNIQTENRSSWLGKRVLVTGAGGFIGSHLAERLVSLGANVRAMVHYNAVGNWGWLDESPFRDEIDVVAGDIMDRDSVDSAVRGREVVFHLAALIGIPYSYHAPTSYVRTNIEGTLNVLVASRDRDVQRILHTSTSETYGSAIFVPIDETHPLQGQSPYSASKIGADKMVEAFHLAFDTPVVTIRPFNTFGPRQSSRATIPSMITQCLTGNVVRVGNLYPTRDFNFVSNTVDGFVAAAVSPSALGRVINLGSGGEISIGDLLQLIASLTGREVSVEIENGRKRPERSEVKRLVADNTLAERLLGWRPAVSLEEGLKHTIAWLKEHLEKYRPDVYAV